jgi:hypothetical protein
MRSLVVGLALLCACSTPRAPVTEPAPDAGTLRQTPPPNIERTAPAVHAAAPPLDLPTASGESWSLADARHRPAILAFYRGHW